MLSFYARCVLLLQPADKRSHPMTDTKNIQQSMEQSRLRCVIVTSQGQSKDMMCLVCFHYMTSCQMQNLLGLEDQRYV